MIRTPRRSSALAASCAAYLAFAAPAAMLGAGWPEARHRFDRPSSALGLVAMAYGLGRLSSSASAQAVLRRRSIGPAVSALLVVLAVAQVVVAVTGSFPVLVGAFAMVGLASGAIDSLGSRYQTVVRSVRGAGLMFGAYGIGATIGPAAVALTTWTTAFLASAVVALVAAAWTASPAVAWPAGIESPGTAPARVTRADRGERAAIPRGPLVLSLLCFALYCAVEVSTGNWISTYFEEHRELGARWAGLAVSGFWAAVTLGRLAMSTLRAGPHRILTVAAPLVTAAYLSVPLLPDPLAVVAVLVGGAAVAMVMPTLMITTAERVGEAAAGRVTGYQLLAANVGGTGSSALIGVIVARSGEGAPIWVLIAISVVALPVVLRSLRLHPPAPAPAEPSSPSSAAAAGHQPRSAGSGNDSPGGKRPIDR